MSGICGLVNGGGLPVDRQLLQEMTTFMAFRGPDAQNIWIDGPVGFGHTLLRTTFESEQERQPLSLDRRVWITADARIDGQGELKKKLAACGRPGLSAANDVELILYAYFTWGEACLTHLIGDFAFAIWDSRIQRLFCARDQFGVKPFFYARHRNGVAFSNTLDCLRQHPNLSDCLNDLAITDFLMFGGSQDPGMTAFVDIFRLPPGHSLTYSFEKLEIRRYWKLSTDGPVEYRKKRDYVDHFLELFEQAISDRLRTNRIGVELTGGMDSTSVATVAHAFLSRQRMPFVMHAQTMVYDRLIPDEERFYSTLVAERLGIPIDFVVADDYQLFEKADQPELRTPEPNPDPVNIRSIDSFKRASISSRVMLTGWEGDGFLHESPKPYFRQLLHEGKLGLLLSEAAGYGIAHRKFLPHGLIDWLARRTSNPHVWVADYPKWLAPEIEERLGLKSRWEQIQHSVANDFCVRPRAIRTMKELTQTAPFFEYYDSGQTGYPIEYRHPLLDLRLLDFLMSLPPYPWCIQKHILREAMRERLPEPVRLRAKAPLAGYPYLELLALPNSRWVDNFVANDELLRYVTLAKLPHLFGSKDPYSAWLNLRPLCLNIWLNSR